MKNFKKQFNNANELIAYFMLNGIDLNAPCEIQINSIYDWVSDSTFENDANNSLQNNSPAATHRTIRCDE